MSGRDKRQANPAIYPISFPNNSLDIISMCIYTFCRNRKKIRSQELSLFFRQLSTLTSAGVPLSHSFQVIEQGFAKSLPKSPLLAIIKKIHHNISVGNTFSSSLRSYSTIFNPLYSGLIEIGEHSGTLDLILIKIASHHEKLETFKRKLKIAITYPACVLVISFILVFVLMFNVVPIFQELFESFNLELPFITHALLKLSRYLKQNCILLLLVLLCLVLSIKILHTKIPAFKHSVQHLLNLLYLKLPVVSKLYKINMMARFASSLAITQASGLPLINAIETIAKISNNPIYKKNMQTLITMLNQGLRLQAAMQKTNFFFPIVIQMIGIGEESGSLETLLEKIADLYEEEFNAKLMQLTTLLEPLMMVVLGLGVGSLVIALYLPMFNMGALF